MTKNHWVYVNQPNDKALVHLSDCGFCNDGHGVDSPHNHQNGEWIGPFDRNEAIQYAKGMNKMLTRWCKHCAKRLGIDPNFLAE